MCPGPSFRLECRHGRELHRYPSSPRSRTLQQRMPEGKWTSLEYAGKSRPSTLCRFPALLLSIPAEAKHKHHTHTTYCITEIVIIIIKYATRSLSLCNVS